MRDEGKVEEVEGSIGDEVDTMEDDMKGGRGEWGG